MSSICLVCTDPIGFVCIGACNHPICSTCALRIRFKTRDLKCVVCKSTCDVMIVSSTSPTTSSVKRFEEFELLGTIAAGGILMEEASLMFIDCLSHYASMKALISFHCPHESCSRDKPHRYANVDQVLKHLQTKHNKFLCKLCVQHRALFISEHTLYSHKELSKHLKVPSGKDRHQTAVHPLCQFCNENLYDAADLFQHMRNAHFTCRLCPIEFQHRYYQTSASLNAHIAEQHFVCPHPSCVEQLVAFPSQTQYTAHMKTFHNAHEPTVRMGFNFGSGSLATDNPLARAYIDLHSSSADPNVSSSSSSSTIRISELIPTSLSTGPVIPSNMRVAGKVKNGVMKRDASDDVLEKALTEIKPQGRRGGLKMSAGSRKEEFPALTTKAEVAVKLASAKNTSASMSTTTSLHEPHPLSSMTKERRLKMVEAERARREAEADAKLRQEEDAQRRRQRNDELGRAFGITRYDFVESAGRQFIDPAFDIRSLVDAPIPIYTAELIRWTKANPVEVLRIERRVSNFIVDQGATTLSLKPMKAGHRDLIHDYAKYYSLFSHEYDPEPYRYVALVKSVDTDAPSVTLSDASKQSVFVVTPQLHELRTPSIYFVIRYTGAGMSLRIFVNKLLAEISKAPSLSMYSDRHIITRIRLDGACAVVVDFVSFQVATEIFVALVEVQSAKSIKAPQAGTVLASLMSRHFIELFEIEVAFRLEEYLADHQVLVLDVQRAEAEWNSRHNRQFPSSSSLADLKAEDAEDAAADQSSVLVAGSHVTSTPHTADYLSWHFSVGGNVSVAYAVGVTETGGDGWSTSPTTTTMAENEGAERRVQLPVAVAETWEDVEDFEVAVETTHAVAFAANDRSCDEVYGGAPQTQDVEGIVAEQFQAESGSAADEVVRALAAKQRAGEGYRRLQLAPRTLPPPLPPLVPAPPKVNHKPPHPQAKKLDKHSEDAKLGARPHTGNMFNSLGYSGDDSSEEEYAESKAVLQEVRAVDFDDTLPWTCVHCTFINSPSSDAARICIMCENMS